MMMFMLVFVCMFLVYVRLSMGLLLMMLMDMVVIELSSGVEF